MATRWRHRPGLWVTALVLCGCVALHFPPITYLVVGRPKTPMNVADAEHLIGQVASLGETWEDVQARLAGRDITPEHRPGRPLCDILLRDEWDAEGADGEWMDGQGDQTVADLAGLDPQEVHSIIRLWYYDANRSIVSNTEVMAYLFFDAESRLLGRWVDEHHIGL
ncbi:hypothetical protein [Tautonia rosea]|uniref:hypothetical protein n=1 Tax=Tautonia rosea TaxID=2728037 RepID=UPI001472746C|nr:hypothetical protein [Tautonia rosea]